MRSLRRIAFILVATLASTLLLLPSANATVAQGFIGGAGVVTDDWGDEGILAQDTFPNSNATGLWQTVLYADGYLSLNQIDCQFGPQTAGATEDWQADRGLDDDGQVGPLTFGRADSRLRTVDIDGEPTTIVRYDGTARDVDFLRIDGRYNIPDRYLDGTSGSHLASYHSRLSSC